jgi:alpha-L-fucosidase
LWNADSIASLAKAAGMRSIVITSKHHDGFCMFQSAHTDFNVVEATPFKRDIIKELSEACKRKGLKFGLYFSLIDWHYPQASPISSHNSDYITPEHHDFNKKQVTELLTNYGTISELWFDMGSQNAEQSKELRNLVHKLQPNCLVSSRIGNDMGDFTVMGDNQEPDYSIGVPWQSPASFFDETWGYRSWQKRGSEEEKVREKLASLIRVISRGGNYLLNIGPKGDGTVVDFERNVLRSIGSWLQKNSEAVYGTKPDPFQVAFAWGSVTSRNDKLYLHLLSNPKDGVINLPGLNGKITKAYRLADGSPITFSKNDTGFTIQVPKTLDTQKEYQVIVVQFTEGYSVTPPHILSENNNNVIELSHNNSFKYYSNSGVDYNTRVRSTVKESWSITSKKKGLYVPQILYTDEEKGKEIVLTNGSETSVILLKDDELIHLQNNLATIEWGPKYVAGPFWSGLEGTEGSIANIDLTKPWPRADGLTWKVLTDWKKGKPYTFSGDAMQAYYVLQELTSTADQQLLIDIISGDGVAVFVNGEQKLVHLNPHRKGSQRDVLLIDLKKGKNQLVVKFFNNFQKNILAMIEPSQQQVMYGKKVAPMTFDGKLNTVTLKLSQPITPHQDMLVPNLKVILRPK